jgi:hypothetical protein
MKFESSAQPQFRVMMGSKTGRQMINTQRVVMILSLAILAACEPMGPLPGGQLSGVVEALPENWASSSEMEVVQIETRSDSPYSINIWAVDFGDSIYIASGSGPKTEWVSHLEENPEIRLRLENNIYELVVVKVTDSAELVGVHARYVEKYDLQSDVTPQDAWVYRLDPR